jgi:hypothetical protein
MKPALRNALLIASLTGLAAFTAPSALAQADPHQHDAPGAAGKPAQGAGGMMGGQGMGMGGMMGGQGMGMGGTMGCPMMQGGGHAMPHLPPGNEKLELQMHAEMMKAVGDILAKYAARLPERK